MSTKQGMVEAWNSMSEIVLLPNFKQVKEWLHVLHN
jgi:hypothetical protein